MDQGRDCIIYTKISLVEMLYITQYVMTALQEWLKNAQWDSLTKIPGDNVSVVTVQIDAICECLEVKLLFDAPADEASIKKQCIIPLQRILTL